MRLRLRHLLLLAALSAAAGALLWFCCRREDDAARIRRAVTELAQCLCRTSGESAPTGLLKSKTAADAFTDPAEITLDEYAFGQMTREQLLSRVMQYRALIENASVDVSNIQVAFTAPDRAECSFAGRFAGTAKSGAAHREVRDLSAVFVRENGQWKIQSVQFEKVLH